MDLTRRQFTKEFKLAAVRRLEQGVSIAEAARALEIDFLKGCLQRIEEQWMLQGVDWKCAVYGKVQEEVKATGTDN